MLSLRLREKANAAVKWQRKFVGFVSNGLPDYLFEINDIHSNGQADGHICSITIKKGNIMSDIIGTNAGIIWKYLDKHGPTTVAKLIRETEVDEKSIQRGIGWLAQEGKVTIELVNRAETIALK